MVEPSSLQWSPEKWAPPLDDGLTLNFEFTGDVVALV